MKCFEIDPEEREIANIMNSIKRDLKSIQAKMKTLSNKIKDEGYDCDIELDNKAELARIHFFSDDEYFIYDMEIK